MLRGNKRRFNPGLLICSDADPNRLIMTQTERKESRIYDFPFEAIPKWRNIWLLPFPICAHIAISFNMFSHLFCILGVFNKSIFFRLDRICEDCYSLFREVELHSLCKWVSCSSCCSSPLCEIFGDSFASWSDWLWKLKLSRFKMSYITQRISDYGRPPAIRAEKNGMRGNRFNLHFRGFPSNTFLR